MSNITMIAREEFARMANKADSLTEDYNRASVHCLYYKLAYAEAKVTYSESKSGEVKCQAYHNLSYTKFMFESFSKDLLHIDKHFKMLVRKLKASEVI